MYSERAGGQLRLQLTLGALGTVCKDIRQIQTNISGMNIVLVFIMFILKTSWSFIWYINLHFCKIQTHTYCSIQLKTGSYLLMKLNMKLIVTRLIKIHNLCKLLICHLNYDKIHINNYFQMNKINKQNHKQYTYHSVISIIISRTFACPVSDCKHCLSRKHTC